jgi:hypothetical protein
MCSENMTEPQFMKVGLPTCTFSWEHLLKAKSDLITWGMDQAPHHPILPTPWRVLTPESLQLSEHLGAPTGPLAIGS